MSTLAIVTCFWRRARVSRVYWAGIARLRAAHHGLRVVAVLSRDDHDNITMARQRGAHVTIAFHPNEPLCDKFNAGTRAARRLRGVDRVMVLGSDDVLSTSALRLLLAASTRAAVVGPRDFYFYDAATARLKYWPGYASTHERAGRPIGAGRIMTRDVLDHFAWAPWPHHPVQRGQDGQLDLALLHAGVELQSVALQPVGAFGVDVKSDDNLWSYEQQPGTPVDVAMMRAQLSRHELRALDRLRAS